jgi:hypothetical protein
MHCTISVIFSLKLEKFHCLSDAHVGVADDA